MSTSPQTQDHVVRRREIFAPFITRDAPGLEIGASFMPTLPKRDGWNTLVLDHATKEELQREFRSDPGADQGGVLAMEDVDIVMAGGRGLAAAVADRAPFHHIVACHVIEHVPDLVEFLDDISAVLSESGVLLLAVPTRELSFDFYRPLTSPGDVVVAHLEPEAAAVGAMVDSSVLRAELGGAAAWLPWELEVALREGILPDMVRQDDGFLRAVQAAEQSLSAAARDWTGHRWVFEPESFRYLMGFIAATYRIPLAVEALEPGLGSEFLVVLRRTSSPPEGTTGEPGRDLRQTYASRQAVDVRSDVAARANDIVAAQLIHHRNLSERLQARYDGLRLHPVIRVTASLLRRLRLL